ncbi:MAG: radical SAM protein [Candidatus Omnitrophota bacterium]
MQNARQKIDELVSYYRRNGLVKTGRSIVDKAVQLIRPAVDPFEYRYPEEISIEIMDICNLRCPHCYLPAQRHSDPGLMDLDLFKRIIERISPLIGRAKKTSFPSIEPLFHNKIFEMVDCVKEKNKNIAIPINTNAMLLDDTKIDNLLKRKVYRYYISLDGCTKETVESFKIGADFDKVVRNIRRLKEKGGDRVFMIANYVLHRKNAHELLNYVDFCKDLGMRAIHVSGFITHTPEMTRDCLYSENGIKEIDELFEKAKKKAAAVGIGFFHCGTKLKPGGCALASTMYIDKKGNVAPCVSFVRKTRMVLLDKSGTTEPVLWGNVLTEDPYRIWTSKASVDHRRLLLERKLPEECSLCAEGLSVVH